MKNRLLGVCALLFLFAIGAGGQTLEFSSEVYSVGEGQGLVTLTVINPARHPARSQSNMRQAIFRPVDRRPRQRKIIRQAAER
jgi:hypothetical protein